MDSQKVSELTEVKEILIENIDEDAGEDAGEDGKNIEKVVDIEKVVEDEEDKEDEEDDEDDEDEEEKVGDEAWKQQLMNDDVSTDEEADEPEPEVFRKFEKEAYEKILTKYHPEIKQNNYNEILAMCKVVKNSIGNIIDPLHKTIPWLTKYERARILGLRAKQLSDGADAFIEVPVGMISSHKIALEELNKKKIPFIIRRPIPNSGNEYWKLHDLELLDSY